MDHQLPFKFTIIKYILKSLFQQLFYHNIINKSLEFILSNLVIINL